LEVVMTQAVPAVGEVVVVLIECPAEPASGLSRLLGALWRL
jgi:hypothetical protein